MAKTKKTLNYQGMVDRIAETTTPNASTKEGTKTPPKGNPIYSIPPRTASYQDSLMAYNSIKGKAAGAENLKPKGGPKKYIGQTKK
jgi:hypothetical protein